MKPKPYADTKVSVLKSRADIDKLLHAYGITAVQWTTIDDRSILRFQFEHAGQQLMCRFVVDPARQGQQPPRHADAKKRKAHWEKEARRLHRQLYWGTKVKLELIDSGLESALSVWLPAIEAGQSTFAERIEPRVAEFASPDYSVGGMLALPEGR